MLDKPVHLTSMDIAKQKQKQLKKIFPEIFNEDTIDFNQLKRVLGIEVVPEKERFAFRWPGKAECMKSIQAPAQGTLKPCQAESLDWDTTKNLFIEGDNLEVLKLLQKAYFGKIKMIYIDPPYNTGKEFIYSDQYNEGIPTYLRTTGQIDSKGDKLVTLSDRDGRWHSKWLNMIYPRLYLARNFLREDGVIFISINDNEQSNMKKICDEIFGEENFIATFVWNTKKGAQGMFTQNKIVPNHEYVLVYAKDQEKFAFLGMDRNMDEFSNPDNDPRGPWKRQYLQRKGQNLPIRVVRNPKTGYEHSVETPYTQEKINKWIKEDRIIFPDVKTHYPAKKEFLHEYKNKKQLVTSIGLYPTKSSTEDLYRLFDGLKIFPSPKPANLIKNFLKFTTTCDDIIMDFFAGSATTAHATLQLNQEDGGQRKYICVQLPELLDKNTEGYQAGFQTIADIGKERIRKVVKQIKTERAVFDGMDLGFRVFKLDTSCFKKWNSKLTKDKQAFFKLIEEQVDGMDPRVSTEDILYEILMKYGFSLTVPIETLKVKGKIVYALQDGAYFICLETDLTKEFLWALAGCQPKKVICLDAGFRGDDALKLNAIHTFQSSIDFVAI